MILSLNIKNFNLNDTEAKILRKVLEWPKIVEISSSKNLNLIELLITCMI